MLPEIDPTRPAMLRGSNRLAWSWCFEKRSAAVLCRVDWLGGHVSGTGGSQSVRRAMGWTPTQWVKTEDGRLPGRRSSAISLDSGALNWTALIEHDELRKNDIKKSPDSMDKCPLSPGRNVFWGCWDSNPGPFALSPRLIIYIGQKKPNKKSTADASSLCALPLSYTP